MVTETGLSVSIGTGNETTVLSQPYNEIEFRRAHNALEDYCQRHNQHRSGMPLAIECCAPCLLLAEFDRRSNITQPQLKCCLMEEGWFVYVPYRDGGWIAYPNLPQATGYESIISELERAPLHVHWS
jgi:hypothetical protein